MKNLPWLLLLLGALPLFAQAPSPRISGADYAGGAIGVTFISQTNPFQSSGYDSVRTEVVLVTQLTTSLQSAAALGDNSNHPVIATWFSGSPDRVRIPLKPSFRARYFVAASFSAVTQGRRIRSPWGVWADASSGPIAVSASPASQEENPEVQATSIVPIDSGALVEARFSLFATASTNAEIRIVKDNVPVLHIPNPATISSGGGLVVASSLAEAMVQASAATRTVLLRELRTGHPTLYRLFHFVPDIQVGDTVGVGITDPDGRVLYEGPVPILGPKGSVHMGRSLQTLLCHPPQGQANLFTGFTTFQSQDSLSVGLLAMAMLRTQIPHASGFEEGLSGLDYSSRYLQAFDSCIAAWPGLGAWPGLAGLEPGLPRLRTLRTRLLSLASGSVQEPIDEAARIIPPMLAYESYTRIVPDYPLMTRPSGGAALLLVVSPNVSLHALRRTGLSAEFPELVNADQVTGMLFPADSSTLNPMLRQGLYLLGKPTKENRTTQYGFLQRVVRRPLGIAGDGAMHPTQRVTFPGGMVREGILQAGLGETAFRIWGQDDKGRWVSSPRYSHLLLGGQRRRLVVDGTRRVGDFLHVEVAGPDSALLVREGGLQEGKLPGIPKALWQEVRALDTVGSDTGGIWFRALDWSVEGSGDTVVHRAFEKHGSLLGMLLARQSAANPYLIRTDGLEVGHLHLRAGDLDLLAKLGATLRLTIPTVMKLYNVSAACDQTDATDIFASSAMQDTRIFEDFDKSIHRFNLSSAHDRQLLATHLFSVGDSIPFLHGSTDISSITAAIEFPPDERPYLAKSVTLDGTGTRPYGRIVFDFDKSLTIDANDSALKGSREMQLDFDAETRMDKNDVRKAASDDDDLGELAIKLLDFVPMKIFWNPDKVHNPRECVEHVEILSKNKAIVSRALDIDSMSYLRHKSSTQKLLTRLSPKKIGGTEPQGLIFQRAETRDSTAESILVAMKENERNNFSLEASRNGLNILYDMENVEVRSVYERMAIYSARKNPFTGPDRLADREAVDQYVWEDGKRLNQPPYDLAGSFKRFDLTSIPEYRGVRMGGLDATKDSAIVYIHGFNVKENLGEAYQADKNVYKRLARLGFDGAFISFHWYGDYTKWGRRERITWLFGIPEVIGFVNNIGNAFASSMPFHDLLYGPLGGISKKTVMAHSLGNHVVLDMLRLSTHTHPNTPPLQKYVMIEAAVPRETLQPIPPGQEHEVKSSSWKGLFPSSIRSDIMATNVYNTGDWKVLIGAMVTAQTLKRLSGTLLSPVDCEDAIWRNTWRIPSTIGFCLLPGTPDGEHMAIGVASIPSSYMPVGMVNTNARTLLDESEDEDFKQQHSYYAFDPLYFNRRVYDRILNRERWRDEP